MTGRADDVKRARDQDLQLDSQGIPILADIVISGEQLLAAGITLPPLNADAASRFDQSADLEQRIQEAIDAALPKVTERTADAMRRALLREVQESLRETEQAADSLIE